MIRRHIQKLMHLSGEEWGSLLLGGMLVVGIRVGLACVRYRALSQALERWAERMAQWSPVTQSLPYTDLWAIEVVAQRLLPRRPCLTQALAVCFLLRCHGYDPRLEIGVVKDEDGLQAHAWVVNEGACHCRRRILSRTVCSARTHFISTNPVLNPIPFK